MIESEIRKNIILTADDFGKSEMANRNILKLAEAGKLGRVSVMVGGEISEKEVERLRAANVKLDIHFELIWQKRRRNLLKDRTLRQGAIFFVNYVWGDWHVPENPRSGAKSVGQEWQRQIEKFKEIFGQYPDGISSHEHTHFFPAYFKIALELANRYKIHFIRFGEKGFIGEKNSVYLILRIMHWLNQRKYFSLNISSSDYFTSLDWVTNNKNIFRRIPGGKVEIACHPEREEEYNFVLDNF